MSGALVPSTLLDWAEVLGLGLAHIELALWLEHEEELSSLREQVQKKRSDEREAASNG